MAPAFRWKIAFRGHSFPLYEGYYDSISMEIRAVRRGFGHSGGDPMPPLISGETDGRRFHTRLGERAQNRGRARLSFGGKSQKPYERHCWLD